MFDITVNRIKAADLTNREDIKKSLENSFEPNAFYIGIVEDTNDPHKLGRIRVRIPSLHGGSKENTFYVETSAIPWARPAVMVGAGNDMGQFIVPIKGSRVFVTFEYKDLRHPIYFGGVPTIARFKQ